MIREWYHIEYWRRWKKGLCPRHGVEYKLRGYDDIRYCDPCWEEDRLRWKWPM